eukprot:TRINITY_DN3333_c0_g1_i2.p1 TRINITY_DN3333_c0_g1~~TRINITY_DN3333_c0_g1_i2.p1  ORF type:complete len:329 (+),score=-25.47 TRINITY_DN3333_c0_g1_i2:35-988(+)
MQNYKTIFLRTRANYLLLKITIQSIYYIYFTPQNKNQTPKTYYTKQKIVVIHLPKQIHHLLQHNIIQLTLHYIQKIHNIYILLFMLKHPSTYEQNFHNKLINQSVYFFSHDCHNLSKANCCSKYTKQFFRNYHNLPKANCSFIICQKSIVVRILAAINQLQQKKKNQLANQFIIIHNFQNMLKMIIISGTLENKGIETKNYANFMDKQTSSTTINLYRNIEGFFASRKMIITAVYNFTQIQHQKQKKNITITVKIKYNQKFNCKIPTQLQQDSIIINSYFKFDFDFTKNKPIFQITFYVCSKNQRQYFGLLQTRKYF